MYHIRERTVMMDKKELFSLLDNISRSPDPESIKKALDITDPLLLDTLYGYAYDVKLRNVGSNVYFRGIIEFSNICMKDCYYCGIRKSNTNTKRYELTEDEIITEAQWCYANKYGSLVLQSGERSDSAFTDKIERVLLKIRELSSGGLGVTLSLGEQDAGTYKRWFDAGAHRYLLRIETSNKALYEKIHPAGHSFERRLECLHALRESGYQVGTGALIGFPGQTTADLARDILFFKDIDADMIGMVPYGVHDETPMAKQAADYDPAVQLELGLKMIALTRIVLKDVNIASTTALQALSDTGRERGLKAGANIIMPNVTDLAYRTGYQLYQNKPGIDENAEEQRRNLENNIKSIGERVCYGLWGDSLHFKKRTE